MAATVTSNPNTGIPPTGTPAPNKTVLPAANKMEVANATPTPEVLPAGKAKTTTKETKTRVKRARKEQSETLNEETGADAPVDKADAGTQHYLIVAKSVRNFLKNLPKSCHCGADALPTLNAKVTEMLIEAAERAHSNARKTIKSSDF